MSDTKPTTPDYIVLRSEDVPALAHKIAQRVLQQHLSETAGIVDIVGVFIRAAAVEVPECVPNFKCGLAALSYEASPEQPTEPEAAPKPTLFTQSDIAGMPRTLVCICGVRNCEPTADHGTWCAMHLEYVACLERRVAELSRPTATPAVNVDEMADALRAVHSVVTNMKAIDRGDFQHPEWKREAREENYRRLQHVDDVITRHLARAKGEA